MGTPHGCTRVNWVHENAMGPRECIRHEKAIGVEGCKGHVRMQWAHENVMGARECIAHEKAIGV